METEEIDIAIYILRDILDRMNQLYNFFPSGSNDPLYSSMMSSFTAYRSTFEMFVNQLIDKKVCPF